MAYNFNFMN